MAGDWILGAFERFERVFVLSTRSSPGLAFVGAQAAAHPFDVVASTPVRFSAGGTGVSLEEALTSCLGEGLEFLSQVEREGDVTHTGTVQDVRSLLNHDISTWLGECQSELLSASGRSIDWLTARSADARRMTLVPADLCLRRSESCRKLPLHGPLSTGCAVGRSKEEAATRAILELVERDAVALWWLGGRPGKPVSPSGLIATEAAALLGRLRGGEAGRVAWLLDITTDLDVPTFAALSVDGNERQLACGFAARTTARDAARAAILEMAQGETAFPLIESKLAEGGPAALDEVDRRHLRRGMLDVRACNLLHPDGQPVDWPEGEPHGSAALEDLLQRLRHHGVEAWLTDLTRPDLGLNAIRAFIPTLQPFPSTSRSPRLLRAFAIWGGCNEHAEGVDIM
jgi:ribosomal protein S12 methylthiotransferase accessory factor